MSFTEEEKAALYTDYSKKVYGYIVTKINDPDTASDLCSDVFVKVYEKLDTFDREKASVSTWIYNITKNTLIDYYRTRRVYGEIPENMSAGETPEDEVISAEMLDTLADALESLDERERDLIVLKFYSGMKLVDVAKKMNISYSYAKVLQNKALSAMRKFFD